MVDTIFKLREGVDVYSIGSGILYFYFINSRKGINLEVNQNIIDFISGIDGNRKLDEILNKLELKFSEDLNNFLNFLLNQNIIYIPQNEDKFGINPHDIERYSRQLTFFQEYFRKNPYEMQTKLKNQTILIFGCGAIGSGIAIELAMMGVKNFIFVDKDKISLKSKGRHFYYKLKYIDLYKTSALKDYLLNINNELNIKTYNDSINFDTNLDKYFIHDPTMVINTLDEPYIGITSLKIGRETYKKNLPIFIGGGFDAHLMSTGELIIPNITPCVDCYTNHFTETLKNWKPKYNSNIINIEKREFEVGGISSMSLFSISYGVIEIIKYILSDNIYLGFGRGELLFEELDIKYINVQKNKNCLICGDKNEI